MSSGKETPRQKMIGMMYLVLTALLALNVSKDVLDAFIVVNGGLETTNENFDVQNRNLYAEFDLAKSVDPVRVTPSWTLAQRVKKQSAELTDYISDLQKELIARTEKIDRSVADTLQLKNLNSKDNYDIPTNVLIGESEDGASGLSRQLKNKLMEYREQLTTYIQPKDRNNVKVDISTDDPENSETNENWELYNFFHRPLVASITILSKLKNDVKNAESVVVDYLLKQNDTEVMKFDTIAAKVIPQSNYVLLGEDYKADILVAAFSKTRKPEVLVGNYNELNHTFDKTPESLEVIDGLGKYNVKTTREGIVDYSGIIKMKSPQGKDVVFPFRSEYIVARPALTVAAEKMNVVYLGLDNPISVSVPGVPNEKLAVSATNGTLKASGNGKYILRPTQGNKVDVMVMATMENGEKRNMGTMSFRVRRVPKPVARIATATGGGSLKREDLQVVKGIFADYDNFEFNVPCKITSFDMVYSSKGLTFSLKGNGNQITNEMTEAFRKLKKNEKIYFENIKTIDPSGQPITLAPITINVK